MDRRKIENALIRNAILRDKRFDRIHNKIPKDLYNRLINRKRRVVEEDLNMRISSINKLCDVGSKEEPKTILKGIEPLLRNKRRAILLMESNYEEVRQETEEAIVKYMSLVPKVSVQCKPDSLVYVQEDSLSKDEEEAEGTQ